MMRIAVPVREGRFCEHFGRCTGFLLCDVEEGGRPGRTRQVLRRRPAGKCESLPEWLARMAVTHVLAGGIGELGRARLAERGIAVSTGHAGRNAREVLMKFLAGRTAGGENLCLRFRHVHHHCRPPAKPKRAARRARSDK